MNNLMQKIGKCLDKNGSKSGDDKMLAQKIAALSVLGSMVLGAQVYAANTSLGSTSTVTFGGTETNDGTKQYNSENQLTTTYTASNIAVSRGLQSIYQDGQNLVLKLGSVDTTSSRTRVLNEGTLKIQTVLANQLPSEITWDSTNNQYVLNKNGTITANNTNLVTGGTVYNATGALDNAAVYYTISADNNISQNLVALDNRLSQMSMGGSNNLISESGDTIRIGGNSTASVVNVQNSNGESRVITGVDAGKISADSTDAVNGSQLYSLNNDLHNSLDKLDSRINKVGAGAAALAALHPQDFDPADKWNFAVGYGNYRDANAMALGAFYRPNASTMLSVGGSMGNGENMMNVGFSFKFGQSSPYAGMSRQSLIQALSAQRKDMEELKAQNISQSQQITELKKQNEEMQQQIAEILAKLK